MKQRQKYITVSMILISGVVSLVNTPLQNEYYCINFAYPFKKTLSLIDD